MRLLLSLTTLLVVLLWKPSSAEPEEDDDQIIDLQALLRGVSEALKRVKGALDHCDASLGKQEKAKPRDCSDVYRAGNRKSGVYRIWPTGWESTESFEVLCDMTTDGGGWTVFQTRGDFGLPRDFFLKNWKSYKNGFGDLDKEFWLGNDRIFQLTKQWEYELRVDMWDMEDNSAHAKYSTFWIENEDHLYRLHVGGYSGDAGDSLIDHNGAPFSTIDKDNDAITGSCAETYKGAWWYTACHTANLNGLNLRGPHTSYADGIEWLAFKGYYYSLSATQMKIRPKDFV